MKKRSHYEPLQSCVQKDLTRKINDLLKAQSIRDSDPLAGSVTSRLNLELQKVMDHNNRIGLLAASASKNYPSTSALDTIKNLDALALSASQQAALKAQEKFEAVDQLALLSTHANKNYTLLSCLDQIKNFDSIAGGTTSPLHFDKPTILSPGIPYECFRREALLPPVIKLNPCIALEHNRVTNEPKYPLIIKKNCPEEEYNPNQDEMRVRLLEAVDTYLERQSKKIRQTRERLEFCETEELKQKQEGVIQAHDRLVQWAETIERDYLLLTEEELIQQLQENPEIIAYILQGLQTIKLRNNQLHNEPEFIEKQRIRVAYNHNSFELDDDTDHLLNYEVVRWLDRVRTEGIAGNHEPERNENNANETALHKIEATSEIKFHERDISDRHFEKNLDTEKEVYRIACEHKPRETWPDCVFDELFEIQKRTGETNLKVSERFCEIAGIIEQARALRDSVIIKIPF